jgi:hypothetical protein
MRLALFLKPDNKKLFMAVVAAAIVVVYVSASILVDFEAEDIIVNANGSMAFLGEPMNIVKPLYFVTGRLYVPLYETISAMGEGVSEDDDSYTVSRQGAFSRIMKKNDDGLYKQLVFINEEPYIYIYDLACLYGLNVVFDSGNNQVRLYRKKENDSYRENTAQNKAYLRLEDICADYGAGGNFSDEGLEKLRIVADYLWENGQSYQIAWIPLYINPAMQIKNDLTKNFNFYNAGFLYTLDYLVNRNGKIVLHGLTHQENDTISAVGTEFGPDTPFSNDEIEERMLYAKEIAKTFGFDDDKFEFPHYSFTDNQLKIAEKHFDYICIQYPYSKKYGNIVRIPRLFGTVTYIPTPLGYIRDVSELKDTLNKIETLQGKKLAGLFVHPYIDFNNIKITVNSDGYRISSYGRNGIIPRLVRGMTEKGYVFFRY